MGGCSSKEGDADTQPSSPSGIPSSLENGTLSRAELEQIRIDEEITQGQETARVQNDEKVKLLLLGTGESGKSTIFKQMRILYGSPKTKDDLRMYGVIVRSNIVTAIRKLCQLTRELKVESQLDEESAAARSSDLADTSGMTPREAFDQIVEYIVDNTASEPFPPIPKEQAEQDWVGRSPRAGVQVNKNAELFLQHVEAIRVLWQVSSTRFHIWVFKQLHLFYHAS